MISLHSLRGKRSTFWAAGAALLGAMMMTLVSFASTVHAAAEPDSQGVYRFLEIAQDNDFRVYAKPGETIHVTVYPGVSVATSYPDSELCQVIRILKSNGQAVSGKLRVSGVRDDNTVFGLGKGEALAERNPSDSTEVNTCSTTGSKKPFKELTISYTVPASYTILSMEEAFIVRFVKNTKYTTGSGNNRTDHIQGYEWRIAVSNNQNFINDNTKPDSAAKPGRVWFVGDDSGLDVWQRNAQSALTSNVTTHSFKFVRKDGYRYAVRYGNYHGIWSTFHGGLYGVRVSSSDEPAYMSYGNDSNSTYKFKLPSGEPNVAYVFVDCGWSSDSCPNDVPFLRSQPITSDSGGTGNPIATTNDSATASSGFRYTGYNPSVNLAGGTVTIPYTAMQSGYIRLRVQRGSTLLCQRDYRVDNASGNGIAGTNPTGSNTFTWRFQQDASCSSGTLKTANVATISPAEIVTITAQAYHLGEMHFIDVDTEQRGSIEVKGNGLGSAAQKRSLIWYDPFSRVQADACGTIPPRVGGGDPVAPAKNGSLKDGNNNDSDENLWLSISSTSGTGMNRAAVDSEGGVHGWKSASGCDGSGSGNDDGRAFNDGTATAESTWGNDRVVEDWTYAFQDPAPRTIRIGGPRYTLTPIVGIVGDTAVSVGERKTFNTSVRNESTTGSPSNQTEWVVRKIIVPVNITPESGWNDRTGTASALFGCGYYTSQGMQCSQLSGDSGSRTFSQNTTTTVGVGSSGTAGTYIETANHAIGTRICYAVMVNSASQVAKPNYREVVNCAIVAKYPALQVTNGSVRVGGVFNSSGACTLANDAKDAQNNPYGILMHDYASADRGSYGQYAALALGRIQNFGSRAPYWSSDATTKDLLFGTAGYTNGATSYVDNGLLQGATRLLRGSRTYCLPDVARMYNTSAIGTSNISSDVTIGDLSGLDNTIGYNFTTSNRTVTINNSGPLGKDKRIIVYVKQNSGLSGNTILINDDIVFANNDGYGTTVDLPRLVVIAEGNINIRIAAGVEEISGIYSTGGNVYTCDGYDGVRTMTQETCNRQLTVHGAFIAGGGVLPYRTAGYDSLDDRRPAEVFDLAPWTLLGDYERAKSLPIITTENLRELPTRL